MNSNIVDLSALYNFAGKDKERLGLRGRGPESTNYAREVSKLLKDIEDKKDRGFYIWGKYEKKNALWRTIYLGKAEERITASLFARIRKELSTERLIFWCNPKTEIKSEGEEDSVVKEMKILYKGKKNYSLGWRTAYQKKGATHIIWVATPEIRNNKIKDIEADLIETMNPSANIKRPKPKSELQDQTIAVIREMKRLIHENRPKFKKLKS
jgi:hypothetical protein